jgi:5-methylcytosine-specific restriction endonuclease McrA
LQTQFLHKKMEEWWKTKGVFKHCECCSKLLPRQFSTINVHHLLPKSKYPEVFLNSEYWMLLCADCHMSWELSGKSEFIKNKTQEASKHYNLNRIIAE